MAKRARTGARRNGPSVSTAVVIALAVAGSGCLGDLHQIPKRDLQAIAQQPAASRGKHVRVIQGFQGDAEPPAAQRPRAGAVVVVHQPIWVDGTPHGSYYGAGPSRRPVGPGRGAANHLAKSKADDAKFWLIIAAGAAAILAANEGSREDGWVDLHPMHPVHLYGPGGEYTQLALADIDMQTAQWARRAFVRKSEGPVWNFQRAPLRRLGWSYGLTLGGGEIPIEGLGIERGFLGHIQLMRFWTETTGIGFDVGLGWTRDPDGATVFAARYALEMQVFPVRAGSLHLGLFGQAGLSDRYDDGLQVDEVNAFLGGGALAQLELTTRLALTARAGLTNGHGETAAELTAGVTIY